MIEKPIHVLFFDYFTRIMNPYIAYALKDLKHILINRKALSLEMKTVKATPNWPAIFKSKQNIYFLTMAKYPIMIAFFLTTYSRHAPAIGKKLVLRFRTFYTLPLNLLALHHDERDVDFCQSLMVMVDMSGNYSLDIQIDLMH
jgi:hypothetical protein